MELGRLRAGSSALSSRPQVESRDAATTDSWTSFLQCYDSLLARELAQEQPQFVRALRQLERDSRLQQERQSAQVLATLRLKDAKISELQRLVSEQSEQLDVVLDELERRETKEDKQVQVDVCRDTEDAAVQTETLERTLVDVETQTEQEEGERGVLLLLQKLERELSAVEQRNVALETQLQLQQRATTSETTERRTEDDERMEACLESLQRGVEAMNLSCGCVENPLAFCVGVPREDNDGKGSFGAMATCVNLEHRLEAQAVRLEHLHECLYVWRDAAVQLMKRQNGCDEVPSDNDADSLAVEVQRSLQQKLEFFRKREKDLANLGQYFRMEKMCLQLKSRLDAEQKHAAMLQAALQEPTLQFSRMSSNGSGNEIALGHSPGTEESSNAMESQKHIDFTAKELQKCLTKCAELTSQNTKLARRLREEKEANKQYFTATQELQKQLSARTDANLELNHTLKQYQIQTADLLNPSIAGGNMEISLQSSARNVTAVSGIGEKDTNVPNRSSEHEYEDLREQLASREQENLALVQSLCTIKEKCAQMEAVHEKELRVKAAEHAEAMENYMRTVNETLSRIESDKHRLEDENVKLRAKVQQLEAETTRRELEQTQRSSKGTNTDGNTLESAASSREKESLKARVVDLELQLARERKLTEMVEQKQQLENQHEEQQESAAKLEAAKVKQEYEMRCETLKDLRNKLQHEFAEYQVVEPPTIGKNVSTDELYDLVMDLARAPPQVASKNIASSSQLKRQPKRNVPPSRRQKPGNRGQESVTTSRDTSWSDMLIAEERNQDESEMSEAMLWKLRASKMEAYVRSAMLQNDTFEDTIRQLELGLSNVKEELTSRLARETQLVAKLGALKSELATTKEQAASLAEKYQLTNAELEKRQGEVTNRGDETLRARMAVQRKTELLTQQRAKVASLQQELEQAAKKIERLGAAEKQAALLQQKAKEHTQQLLHARQSYERCRDDNVQLSFHLEKLKERHVAVVTRLKAARAENAQLRTQCSDLKNNTNPATPQAGIGMGRKDTHRGNQDEVNAVSIASLTDEARALKRRVLQKQDVIVSYKSKVAEFEAQLERQRDTMVKLARTNRELQQGQRQRQQQEFEFTSALQAKLEGQLEVKQEQLDGLRASVYDSFEAFVFCQAPVPLRSPSSSSTATLDNPLGGDVPEGNDELFDIKRWTDFSVDDLEELRLARGAQQSRTKRERESQQRSNKINKRKAAAAALRDIEGALETTPEDCRAQICELLQCLCA
ncbi:hypothetical protein PF005_g15343 [Phytophthora fragariae]|uniref:Uncharacterized protein n=1 Tax=Phytophthora fragariae TaxID=53985 RepID=A0A6A3XCX6_9STRA|nr:hypothetical protein PF005_g15343 [Phytophthora fragariae]